MIRYSLKCPNEHGFDSWFQSSSAFDTLRGAGHLSCPECGETRIEKALMAPNVAAKSDAEPVRPVLSAPANPLEAKLRELRAEVEKNAEYVGRDFAREARAIHDGDKDNRPIWGEARLEEAKSLLEDGIAVAPLPFMPSRKAN